MNNEQGSEQGLRAAVSTEGNAHASTESNFRFPLPFKDNVLNSPPDVQDAPRRLPVRTNGRILMLKIEDIIWVEAEHNYVRLHTRDSLHLVRGTMNGMEAKLDSRRFCRIHRSAIVNINFVREIQPWFRGDAIVILDNGQKLTASRNFRSRLREYLL